jgi:hypothetical protein
VFAIKLNSGLLVVAQIDQPIGTGCASYWLKSNRGLLCHLYEGVQSIREHRVAVVAFGVIKVSCQY